MRIAYLTTDFGIPVHGSKGASIHVREFGAALQQQGHEVEIITSRLGGEAPAGFTIPVHEMGLAKPERVLMGALQDDASTSEAVAREVRSMLHAATMRYRVREVFARFRPEAIYERYALMGSAGVEIAREYGIPHILEVNAPLSEEAAVHRGIGYWGAVRATEQRILTAADAVVAVSEQVGRWVIDSGADSERVTVLANGVNVDRFAAAPSLRQRVGAGERPVIGFVGTLKAWHGTATLVRAVAQVARDRGLERAPHLLIVGDGPQRGFIEQVAGEEGIAALVTFTGAVPHDEVPGWIAAMDIAVAPYDESPDFYFSPLKLFEYMAAGRPTVAAGIGQIRDCLRDGETGLLYAPGDLVQLVDRLTFMLDHPERAEAMGQAARADAVRFHGWDRHARVVTELMQRAQVGQTDALVQKGP